MTRSIQKRTKPDDILAVIGAGGFVQFATNDEHERAKQLKGRVVAIKPKKAGRNLKHHRKFFALIRLGFSYWSPVKRLVSDPEEWIAHEVAKTFCELAGNPDMYKVQGIEIAQLVVDRMARKRSTRLDPEAYKSEEKYRSMIMIEAGFFELEHLPSGGVIQRPWSIAFDQMPQEEFNKIYSGCSEVIWNKSLFQIFDDEQQMDNAVNQLMGFI